MRLLSLLLLLLPWGAAATGEQFGKITGLVYDEEGAELVGAKVTLASLVLPDESEVAYTAKEVGFTFSSLAPGKYILTIEHQDKETQRKNVLVRLGETASVYATMKPFWVDGMFDASDLLEPTPFKDIQDSSYFGCVPQSRSYPDPYNFLPTIVEVNSGNPSIYRVDTQRTTQGFTMTQAFLSALPLR